MIQQFVASLERPISAARLASYRNLADTDLDMVVTYFFNIELSESLYPSLNAFEIALRNSVHAALSHHFGTGYWFDHAGLLATWQAGKVAGARGNSRVKGKLTTRTESWPS